MALPVSPDCLSDEVRRFFRARVSVFFPMVFSFCFSIRLDAWPALGLRAQTMVLSETRHGAGLTLVRVLRRGLELDECLGVTAGRADEYSETTLRTLRPGTKKQQARDRPSPPPRDTGASALVWSAWSDRSVLLSSTGAA